MTLGKRILVVGPSGAGKDTACRFLAEVTGLRFAGTTSSYLARHVAARLGVPVEQAYCSRHRDRNLWHRVGNEVRRRERAAPGDQVQDVRADRQAAHDHAGENPEDEGGGRVRRPRQGRYLPRHFARNSEAPEGGARQGGALLEQSSKAGRLLFVNFPLSRPRLIA